MHLTICFPGIRWCKRNGRLMLIVLGGLAEFERELIRERTEEGRKRAMDRGVKFGRPRKMTPHQREEALERLRAGDAQSDVARTYGVDPAVICRLAKLVCAVCSGALIYSKFFNDGGHCWRILAPRTAWRMSKGTLRLSQPGRDVDAKGAKGAIHETERATRWRSTRNATGP